MGENSSLIYILMSLTLWHVKLWIPPRLIPNYENWHKACISIHLMVVPNFLEVLIEFVCKSLKFIYIKEVSLKLNIRHTGLN